MVLRFLLSCMLAFSLGCASSRKPIPAGVIPEAKDPSSADELYGHEVLAGLSEEFKLDQNDAHVSRVRDVVDRLADAAHASSSPWHVYVFDDPTFKNAAATKGNYIFVWSGMLEAVQNDGELATILAHEMGHVLANHTQPEPHEELGNILSGTAGRIASDIVANQGGGWGLAAGLAEMVVSEGIKAAVINPESRRKELEADRIGFFLMSDAGYDPEDALNFWKRAETDPEFSGMQLQFLSSHPSSVDRYQELLKYLPDATERFDSTQHKNKARKATTTRSVEKSPVKKWLVSSEWATIYEEPNGKSAVIVDLPKNAAIMAESYNRDWLHVVKPSDGFAKSSEFMLLSVD